MQAKLAHIKCEGKDIENVWAFKYLGSRFRADGDQYCDIKARIATATSTAGKMRSIWASRSTPLPLKMRIYQTGVCFRLVYGSECWTLDSKACAMLNGANSHMMSRITGKTIHEEASRKTRTFDVVAHIRSRRLQWVGHILRMEEGRLVHQALRYIHDHRKDGDLLMDAPSHLTWTELIMLANDRDGWRSRVRAIKKPPRIEIEISARSPRA